MPAAGPGPNGDPELERLGSRLKTLERLVRSAEQALDDGGHGERVAELAALLARRVGMDPTEIDRLRRAAPLHDVGVVGVSETILNKPGKLTPEEYEAVQDHVYIGAKMLSFGESALLKTARLIALTHHERWDGSGYPYGLAGDDIPLPGRIVAVADVFDTLTRRRPYRRALSVPEAVAEMKHRSGTAFDPALVSALLAALQDREAMLRTGSPDAPALALRGTLDLDTLFDLMGSFTQNRKRGRLSIYVGLTEATLFLDGGQVVHAEFDGAIGEPALQLLFKYAEDYASMTFALEPWDSAATLEPTITTPTQQLLLGAAVAHDHELLDGRDAVGW